MTGEERITAAINRARANRDIRRHITQLEQEKQQLLRRGTLIMLNGSNADRDKWINEYRSICRIINEDTIELRGMAA